MGVAGLQAFTYRLDAIGAEGLAKQLAHGATFGFGEVLDLFSELHWKTDGNGLPSVERCRTDGTPNRENRSAVSPGCISGRAAFANRSRAFFSLPESARSISPCIS
jgi:hypothetical protein